MSKHTAGPYRVQVSSDETLLIVAPEKDNGWSTVLASISAKNTTPAEALATAQLFCAAPEMLEVLEHFLRQGPNAGSSIELLRQVETVVSKARGES